MRRTVATLLVVACPVLMAVPAGAQDGRRAGPTVTPAAPTVVQAVQAVQAVAPVTVAPPAAVAVAPTVPAPATTPAVLRPAVRAVRAKAPTPATVGDAAYAARLQADLCLARAIFCGLDQGGHYPAG